MKWNGESRNRLKHVWTFVLWWGRWMEKQQAIHKWSSQSVIHMGKNKTEPLTSYAKVYFGCTKHLNAKRILEDKIEGYFYNLGVRKYFLRICFFKTSKYHLFFCHYYCCMLLGSTVLCIWELILLVDNAGAGIGLDLKRCEWEWWALQFKLVIFI